MDIIFELENIVKNSENNVNMILSGIDLYSSKETYISRSNEQKVYENLLYHCDNTVAMLDLFKKGYEGKLDLIYIDPPFFTMANYKNRVEIEYLGDKKILQPYAYTDVWKDGFTEYLTMITTRLILMKKLLSDKGSIYVHVDFRTVHYIKLVMDYIFGLDRFLNEVIWSYKSGGTSSKHYSRKHDNILVYTKTDKYIFNPQKEKSYNRGYKPYRFKGVMEYEDSLGWYTLVNLKDVWQIDMVGRTSKERLGYDTQKPESLLERIILSSSDEGSLVADFFAGSGTTLTVAEKNNRKWIGSDKGNSSITTIVKRLNMMDSKPYIINSLIDQESIGQATISDIIINRTSEQELECSFSISSYDLDLEKIQLSKSDKILVQEILLNESLTLIDYISISVEDEKSNHIIIFEDYRGKDKSKINNKLNFKNSNIDNRVRLHIIDIFGNLSSTTIYYRKDE